ncbi:MAG: histidine phosphatase family protein [Leptospiraceae bacterium]|nr:histidine phosphatase family protein [Leptospiraceae bacterium]MCP5493904.1 histidine phosphatase family protein [Leptospiraceae bacterium]
MKTIYLLRHAKSEWDKPFKSDHERPLSKRGRKNAKALREFLEERIKEIDMAYISDSQRTTETFEILTKNNRIVWNKKFTDKVYEANLNELMDLIKSTDDEYNSILIVGHNPGLESLANYLIMRHNTFADFSFFEKFSTCAFLCLRFSIDHWADVTDVQGKLGLYWLPIKEEKKD